MGVGASVATGFRLKADCVGFLYPFFDAEFVAVETGLTFNCGEFAGIEMRIVDGFPDSKKLHGVAVAKPIGDEKVSILGFEHISE